MVQRSYRMYRRNAEAPILLAGAFPLADVPWLILAPFFSRRELERIEAIARELGMEDVPLGRTFVEQLLLSAQIAGVRFRGFDLSFDSHDEDADDAHMSLVLHAQQTGDFKPLLHWMEQNLRPDLQDVVAVHFVDRRRGQREQAVLWPSRGIITVRAEEPLCLIQQLFAGVRP